MKTTLTKEKPAKAKDCPAKPYADFPLFPHATRRWAKRIRGQLHYFGPWDDPQGSLESYLEDKDDLHAGRTPKLKEGELTIQELSNQFLRAKRPRLSPASLTALWAARRVGPRRTA